MKSVFSKKSKWKREKQKNIKMKKNNENDFLFIKYQNLNLHYQLFISNSQTFRSFINPRLQYCQMFLRAPIEKGDYIQILLLFSAFEAI